MAETGDGLDHLRVPFEKINFGKILEVQGYGTVFEGEYDGQRVALKQLNITNLANIKTKLLAEILTISRFRQHPNLVALLGFCDEKSNEITLVYEYVASGNLADRMRKRLATIQRFEICLGAARGLDYLHTGVDPTTPGIVHGNIKLSKILLNSDANSTKFEAKVSSFGLSKIVPGKAQKSLESSDEVTGKVTKESDVYSFGVLLLEVLCGVSELVDTDDYQERHVTELVPKKMQQNKLQKIVHFDIRKEIKPESLETYAKIACQCVVATPDARPKMAQVVEELEKALRLQGGEVTYIQIPGSRSIAGANDETVAKDDGSGVSVTVESNIGGNEPEGVSIRTTEEDVKDLIVGEKLDDVGEDNDDDVSMAGKISESDNGENNAVEDTNTERVPNKTNIDQDAETLSSNNDPATKKQNFNYLNSKRESNITVEIEEEKKRKIPNKDSHKEISITDQEITEETIDDFDTNKKPKITEKKEEDDESMENTITSETSNGATSTSTDQEVQDFEILKSDRGNFIEVIEDELEHLRIPFEKLKFGQKFDVNGYGTMFEGEFNHQQVALKRLNITNLGSIKSKLLSAILTISRFRQHPNLVALIGFCDENNKEIILVYEYISGGNLADNMSKHLTTIQRLQICLGAARGLEYLHGSVESVDLNPGIIHGNLKFSKILLNSDSISSKIEAKVTGFGLPKLLPGHVEIGRRSMDPVHAATGKLTKESDVYSFGVLLLEVLCGVPELVDTDDYQERHVTELVPKRLEQNMLSKIIHFDIRGEITTESLQTYAKIACQCVLKNPEERPTMSKVVEELEKALRLQGGTPSDVQIFGSSNGNNLPQAPIVEHDHEGDDNGETMSSNVTEEESKVIKETVDDINQQGQSFPVPILDTNDVESVPQEAAKENGDSTKEITADLKLNEESKIIGENEVNNENKITISSKSDNGDDGTSSMNSNGLSEVLVGEDDKNGENNGEIMSSTITEKKSKSFPVPVLDSNDVKNLHEDVEKKSGENINVTESTEENVADLKSNEELKIIVANEVDNKSNIITSSSNSAMQEYGFTRPDERSNYENVIGEKDNVSIMSTCNPDNKEIMEVQNSMIVDNNMKYGLLNTEKPELIVNIRGDFNNSATQTQEFESKRSNSSCSKSSNGDDTTPSDYLLPKSPAIVNKTSTDSRNCCSCSWWQFIFDRVVLYGGQFWNKLVSCFNCITGQCSSKKD